MHKFWDFIRDDAGERVLRLEGPIDEDDLWGDAITPQMFRDELEAEEGDVTVWLNSPGGNVFAADQIYNMLCDHKGKITVKIDAIAASAASVIAMAGDTVLISPVGMLVIHDPMTIAMGNTKDMEEAIKTLNEVKESIINAYQRKTGLSHNKIAQLMSDETWLNAKRAVDLHFADGILFAKEEDKEDDEKEEEGSITVEDSWEPFHARRMVQTIWAGLMGHTVKDAAGAGDAPEKPSAETEDKEPSEAGVTDTDTTETDAADKDNAAAADVNNKATGSGGGSPDKEDDPDENTPSGDDPDSAGTSEGESDGPDEEPGEEEEPEEKPQPPRRRSSNASKDTIPDVPVIGMDGKTKDGAVPYEILKKQLDFLK